MRFHVITLFPEIFPGPLGCSLTGRALENDLWKINILDLKLFTNKRSVDDRPYGGGPGLIVKPDVLEGAIEQALGQYSIQKIIYMSPRGPNFVQATARQFSELQEIMVICGRFEGIDQRIIDHYNIEEISVGDYILSSGDLAAMIMMDSCVRLLPGVIGNPLSLSEESFNTEGEVEHSHYTRPAIWKLKEVPEVLRSGNHHKIREWRNKDAAQKKLIKYKQGF